jgi:hypothetical protein
MKLLFILFVIMIMDVILFDVIYLVKLFAFPSESFSLLTQDIHLYNKHVPLKQWGRGNDQTEFNQDCVYT